MGRKRFQPEEIISKLREAAVLLAKRDTLGQVVRRLVAQGIGWSDCGSGEAV